MTKEFWTSAEVIEIFQVKESFITKLVEEEIVCPICGLEAPAPGFSAAELEKLRIAKILVEEMEVNLPGVEVILRMRQNIIDMRRQFDAILEELMGHLKTTLK